MRFSTCASANALRWRFPVAALLSWQRWLRRWQPAGFRPGMPGNFLLMAQKKVTKEEGLNTTWLAAVATTVGC